MRNSETNIVKEVIANFKMQSQNGNLAQKKEKILPSKVQLWNSFINNFERIYGKKFEQNEDTILNIKSLFFYFLEDPKFFGCENLIQNLNEPSFDKGLLIIGGYGIGKTAYLKTFESVFLDLPCLRFKGYSSKQLVNEYEKCSTPLDKDYFFQDKDRIRLFIDDIGSEDKASNYGMYDVIENIISNRYEKRQVTFATTNFASPSHDVEETLEALGLRYGNRIYDRLFEMFNILVFDGKSFRR